MKTKMLGFSKQTQNKRGWGIRLYIADVEIIEFKGDSTTGIRKRPTFTGLSLFDHVQVFIQRGQYRNAFDVVWERVTGHLPAVRDEAVLKDQSDKEIEDWNVEAQQRLEQGIPPPKDARFR